MRYIILRCGTPQRAVKRRRTRGGRRRTVLLDGPPAAALPRTTAVRAVDDAIEREESGLFEFARSRAASAAERRRERGYALVPVQR